MRFSRRSLKSYARQRELEEALRKNKAWLQVAEQNVTRLGKAVSDTKRHMATSGRVMPSYLGDLTRELDNEKLRLSVHEEEAASLRKQIVELEHPSREQAADRLKQQRSLVRLSKERTEQDRHVGDVVAQLRELLEARAEITEKMRAAAERIELENDLDSHRFDALLEALPEDVAQPSESWHRWFTGAERSSRRGESLASEAEEREAAEPVGTQA